MKKFFHRGCKNLPSKSDIYNREEGCDTKEAFSVGELESKTADELRAMLANDSLFSLDDDTNTDAILEILEVIEAKELKTEEQKEVERAEFWTGMLACYGDKIPVRLEDVLHKPRRKLFILIAACKTVSAYAYRAARNLAISAVITLVLLVANSFIGYAWRVNVLQTIVSFSDELFSKVLTFADDTPIGSEDSRQFKTQSGFPALLGALDELGVYDVRIPEWKPDGFRFESLQIADMRGSKLIVAQYTNGDKRLSLTYRIYEQVPVDAAHEFEKSYGNPEVYEANGVVHYIFSNLDVVVATWVDEMSDCHIQGNISVEEMKQIINSIYQEESIK
ncbi:MAG: DUF4367 domain-containing protein [Oscillospiraceae bacterium]|jgi:hypothetical protein|nr:DUF4367 domain-containing protein [Oscillospiraceae bacterium]